MKSKAFDHSKYPAWIDPSEVKPYERNAKIHTPAQIKNIVTSIRRFGWQQDTVLTTDNVLVIGHGRRLAAIELGCEMPYHVIDKTADELTDEDIRELRIADNQTNAETGIDFSVLELEIEDLDFEGFDFDFGFEEPAGDYEPEEDNTYTSKTDIPQYEPSNEDVSLNDCLDKEKYETLMQHIKQSGVTDDEKYFLCMAAARHLRFSYKKIADFYASKATKEMQELMEESALVLIDYVDAIKNGYAVLRKTVTGLLENEE